MDDKQEQINKLKSLLDYAAQFILHNTECTCMISRRSGHCPRDQIVKKLQEAGVID